MTLVKEAGLPDSTMHAIVPSLVILQPYAVEIRYPFRLSGAEGMEDQAFQEVQKIADLIEGWLSTQGI